MDLMKFMDELYTTDSNFKIVRNKYYYGHNKNNEIDSDPSRYRYLLMWQRQVIYANRRPNLFIGTICNRFKYKKKTVKHNLNCLKNIVS